MKTFERSELYKEVWQTPMTTLAQKYGLSDNGLRKICIKLAIPMPAAGYWARTTVGYRDTPPALPPFNGPSQYQRINSASQPDVVLDEEYVPWLKDSLAFEADPANQIRVESEPRRWHPAIQPIKTWLDGCVSDLKRVRKEEEDREKRPRRSTTIDWQLAIGPRIHDNFPILGKSFRPRAVRVSEGTYERALAILNALAVAAQDRGYEVSIRGDLERISLAGRGESLTLTMTEQIERHVAPSSQPRYEFGLPRGEHMPSGKLRINLERSPGSVITVTDTSDVALENVLNDVLCRLHRALARSAAIHLQQERDRRDREARAAAKAALDVARQRREAELAELQRIEDFARERNKAMAKRVVSQAEGLQQAALVRAYIENVVQLASRNESGVSPSTLSSWVTWAAAVADEIDPTRCVLGELRAASYSPACSEPSDKHLL